MIKSIWAGLLVASAVTATSFANPADDITMHVEIVSTPDDVFSTIDRLPTQPNVSRYDNAISFDMIVNLGKQAWKVIVANEPVLNVKYDYANALPSGVRSGRDLDGFSDLQSYSARLYGTNGFGATVYDLTLSAVHQYGGNYDGKGQYLETVAIVPTDVSVLWGYSVDVGVTKVSTVNHGTKHAPIAGISVESTLKVSTIIKKIEQRILYQFRGDSPTVRTHGL